VHQYLIQHTRSRCQSGRRGAQGTQKRLQVWFSYWAQRQPREKRRRTRAQRPRGHSRPMSSKARREEEEGTTKCVKRKRGTGDCNKDSDSRSRRSQTTPKEEQEDPLDDKEPNYNPFEDAVLNSGSDDIVRFLSQAPAAAAAAHHLPVHTPHNCHRYAY